MKWIDGTDIVIDEGHRLTVAEWALLSLATACVALLAWVAFTAPAPTGSADDAAELAQIAEWYSMGAIPCPSEDVTDNVTACVWDAKRMGNGQGRSFLVTDDGEVFYADGRN